MLRLVELWLVWLSVLRQGYGEHGQTLRLSSSESLSSLIGANVQVEYTECFLSDYQRGDSGRYIQSSKLLKTD